MRKSILVLLLILPTLTVKAFFLANGFCWAVDGSGSVTLYNHTALGYPYTNRYKGDIVIPESIVYDGTTYTVVAIASKAFYECDQVTSISIPKTIKYIGGNAFRGCEGLQSVYIPDLTSWCNISFANEYSNPLTYAHQLLVNNEPLLDLEIPNDVTTIGQYTFCNVDLNSIKIESNVEINSNAFYNVNVNSVCIGNNVNDINSDAFYNCSTSYLSINCPEIGQWVRGISPKEIKVGKDVERIGYAAFYNCKSLNVVTMEDGITEIENKAFSYCDSLSYVEIPNSVKHIGSEAFYLCENLTSVTVPNSADIGFLAFAFCSGLTSIIFIPNSVTTIGNRAFWYCSGLNSLTIPSSSISIGEYAFADCINLDSVIIGNGINNIGRGAFENCNISYLSLNCTQIGSWFSGMKSISTVDIGNDVMVIETWAFKDCTSLTTLNNGNGITEIGESAFEGCTNLKSFTIPSCMKKIGRDAFMNCTGLTSVNISDLASWCSISFWNSSSNPLSYAHNLYMNDEEVKELKIPDNVTSISNYAFYGCNMVSVNIPSSITRIGAYGFYGCDNITDIFIPNNVKQMGGEAFWGCSNLRNVLWLMELNNNDGISSYLPNCCSVYGYVKPEIWYNYGIIPIINVQATNRTLKIDATNGFEIKAISEIGGSKGRLEDDGYLFKGLSINQSYEGTIKGKFMQWDDVEFTISESTKPIDVSFDNNIGVTKATLNGSYSVIDATVTESGFTKNKQDQLFVEGLEPNSSYYETYYLYADDDYYQTGTNWFYTNWLKMITQAAQAISDTKMRLMAETNCDDEALRCGFEWRRYDAPDEMPSSSASCAVYNGYLMGTLSNLTPNVYYKYRPYYKADSGRKYYGNWVAFLTADAAVFFEPEVHTFEAQEVADQTAKVRGYVLAGSDDILEQGFEYWSNSGNHLKQTSSGMLMSTTLNNLTEGTDYYFRSYVKTDKKTLYGEELKFHTLGNPSSGIQSQLNEHIDDDVIYDAMGRKVKSMHKGRLYIKNGRKFIAK